MKDINDNNSSPERYTVKEKDVYIEGYPPHPAEEDIYAQSEREANVDPEDIFQNKKREGKKWRRDEQ